MATRFRGCHYCNNAYLSGSCKSQVLADESGIDQLTFPVAEASARKDKHCQTSVLFGQLEWVDSTRVWSKFILKTPMPILPVLRKENALAIRLASKNLSQICSNDHGFSDIVYLRDSPPKPHKILGSDSRASEPATKGRASDTIESEPLRVEANGPDLFPFDQERSHD